MTRTLVFAGDSLTDARHREPEFAPLGYGFVSSLADILAASQWHVINAGVAGDTVRDLHARWASDIEAHTPAVISILIGINDVWRRFSHDEPTTVEEYTSIYREILDASITGPSTLLLCEPFLVPITPDQLTWGDDLDEKRAAVRRLAGDYGAMFVPLHDAINKDAVNLGYAEITKDGVHLTEVGHRLLASHWQSIAGEALGI